MTDKPRFTLELHLSRIGARIGIEDPALIPDKLLDQAWNLMSNFVMDMLDELGEEVTDERYREIFLEICYRLIIREITTLYSLPILEESWKENLGTRRTGVRVRRKGPYDDK